MNFSGLMPQLVGELFILWVSSTALFAFDRYLGQNRGVSNLPHAFRINYYVEIF